MTTTQSPAAAELDSRPPTPHELIRFVIARWRSEAGRPTLEQEHPQPREVYQAMSYLAFSATRARTEQEYRRARGGVVSAGASDR